MGLLYGAGITAVVEGGIIGYHNIDDFRHDRVPPNNATLERCLKDWGAENALEFSQAMYGLISIAPAVLIGIIISCLQSRTPADTSETTLLIADDAPTKAPRSTYLKILIMALHGVAIAAAALGIFGAPLTLASANFPREYKEDHPDATDKDCYKAWGFKDIIDFTETVTICLGFLIGGILLSCYWQSEKKNPHPEEAIPSPRL